MQGEENVWHILKITTWVRVDLLHNHKPKTFDLLWVHRAPSSEERGLGMSDVRLVFQLCLPEFVIRYLGSSIADLWMNLLKCSSVTAANWTCPPYEWLLKPRYCSRLPFTFFIFYIWKNIFDCWAFSVKRKVIRSVPRQLSACESSSLVPMRGAVEYKKIVKS